MDRELLLELKEFLTERMVDNMSTKDLEEYVSDDLFNYFDKLGECPKYIEDKERPFRSGLRFESSDIMDDRWYLSLIHI